MRIEYGVSKGKEFPLLRLDTDHRWPERWSFFRFISKIETNRLTTDVNKPTMAAVRTITSISSPPFNKKRDV